MSLDRNSPAAADVWQRTEQALRAYGDALAASDQDPSAASHAHVRDLWLSWVIHNRRRFRPKYEVAFANHMRKSVSAELSRAYPDQRVLMLSSTDAGAQRVGMRLTVGRGTPNRAPPRILIAIKAAWNDAVLEGVDELAEQLRSPDLAPFGIYLVGWFECTSWDVQDGRAQATRRLDRDGTLVQLRHKAAALAAEGISVAVCDVSVHLTPFA